MTSAGMMDCKNALIEAEGDFEKAVDIIREKGKLVAAKRADRATTEGAVVVRINGNKAVIVCLGCETDFVSATPEFKALANEIADAAIAEYPADLEALKAAKCSNGHTVEEEISAQTGKTGEKHDLAYYASLEAPCISSYVHFNNKLGAIVAFNKEVPAELGRGIAMQVTSMNPAAMLENIAKGKLSKFFKEATLEDQDFVQADGKMTVKEYIQSVDKEAKVVAFKRFSLTD